MNLAPLITQLTERQSLSYKSMREVMLAMMSGQVDSIQTAGFLTALAAKGETPEEILAGAEIMRKLATPIKVNNNEYLVDPVGTGGTNSRVFNVSTASAIVAACAGVKIAKHGGRAASSKSGSADFLEAAGINIDLTPEQIAVCVEHFGIGFMFAPNLHAAMRHVVPVRKALGVRTIFNLLGPLTNPSGAQRQVLGVFAKQWLLPMAEVSQKLGKKRVMVVHSQDGLDEISIAAPSDIAELKEGSISQYRLNPHDYGIAHISLDAVRVESADESLRLINAAFSGQHGAAYDMIALNSAAIMQVSDLFCDFHEALTAARQILDSGQARQKLSEYADYTQTIK